MLQQETLQLDTAVAINRGKRATQEDAILSDFTIGNRMGLVVLADGMGGHNAGDVASTLVTTEVFRELRYATPKMLENPGNIPQMLWSAACKVNAYIGQHVAENPQAQGMGCTLVIAVQMGAELFWLSVGDSPIYLLRDGAMQRLNEDHSLAPQIDLMADEGLLTPEQARTHPDRSLLTSAINGQEIRFVDCRDTPFTLQRGDTVIVASDGLCSLDPDALLQIVGDTARASCAKTSAEMLSAIQKVDCPNQDNVCFAILQAPDDPDDQAPIDAIRVDQVPAPITPGAPRRQRPFTRLLKVAGGSAAP